MRVLFISVFITCFNLFAEAVLANIFQDKMVLQRDVPLTIWGTGEKGLEVFLKIGNYDKSTLVDNEGNWKVIIEPLQLSLEPIIFEFRSEEHTRSLTDVLVGDVWFCSGQSNMVLAVEYSENAEYEISTSENTNVRLFTVPQSYSSDPIENKNTIGNWGLCIPENVKWFSATSYYFGRELNHNLNVPIGLINSSYGSSRIETWTSIEGNLKTESGSQYIEDLINGAYPDLEEFNYPAALFKAMIIPYTELKIKGFVWYQGERNSRTREGCYNYRFQLPAMIQDWRDRWSNNELPFYFVQLPNFNTYWDWPLIRESMEVVELTEKNVGMAVTIDIGDSYNLHPSNKQEVGRRLAILALDQTYSMDIISKGPTMRDFFIEENYIGLEFDNVFDGLYINGEIASGFEIASADQVFYDADATLKGNTLVVRSDLVKNPIHVRYGCKSDPKCNIYNSADLPMRPFKNYETPFNLPNRIELLQNYPNPFNPYTVITFSIKYPEKISLSIYNSKGQKVRTLVDRLLYSGIHEFKFDGTDLTGGAYFYTLKSENNILSRKMLLVK